MRVGQALPLPGLDMPSTPAEAAQEFEALFWQQMVRCMRRTVPGGKGLGAGPYDRLVDHELGRALAQGSPLGIADLILAEMRAEALQAPVLGRLSSGFGPRADPFTNLPAFHAGVDLAAPAGTPVRAAAAGRVSFKGSKAGLGNTIVIEDTWGRKEIYGHLGSFAVEQGEEVAAGRTLGTIGASGRATGPHLHFEVRIGEGPVDPFGLGLPRSSIKVTGRPADYLNQRE